jgi:Mn2+/Fe2+ NRAMP family transporter
MNEEVKTPSAVLDSAHTGDIRGAFGTIRQGDTAARTTFWSRARTLLAILGPGLIVMVGNNDAGAFSTYAEAGQNYGTSLLWVLLLLVPVLYVNQEMVLRLGSVTGVGHARLILERYGRFWGAFSVIDLFLLNALTIVTEFIGITLGFQYLGLPKEWGVIAAAVLIMAAASTGSFRKFERFSLILCLFSLGLIPIIIYVHPPVVEAIRDTFIPQLPHGAKLNDVMMLIIAIIGTTIAPWQLFFQQSYVIDKRITPRFIPYERVDLWMGIFLVMVGSIILIAFPAALFHGHTEFGHFTDAGDIAGGLEKYFGRAPGVIFAVTLIAASMIGAMAVSLSTAYAIGDVFSANHSLHRKPSEAKAFYVVYCGLIILSAGLVLLPDVPLGLVTNAVQALAGVLLPSATAFLVLLCNDKAVLGPWVNSQGMNFLTHIIVGVLVTLSIILTVAVVFPDLSSQVIVSIMVICAVAGCVAALWGWVSRDHHVHPVETPVMSQEEKNEWRMPPLETLPPVVFTPSTRIWMAVLRGYLVLAGGLVLVHIVHLAMQGAASP